MILKKFLKPKWQHRKLEVRRSAIQKLDSKSEDGQTILAQIVTQDENSSIRLMVVKKIINLDLLDSVSQHDTDERVRSTAAQRYVQLLCGQHSGPGWSERVARIKSIEDTKILEELVRNGVEVELRLSVLDRIQRESLFGDLAISDENLKVRMAALDKITQKSTLERVYKQTRAKDKRISSSAKEKLNAILAEQEKPQQLIKKAKQIFIELEALKNSKDWSNKQLRCNNLIVEWDKILDDWNAGGFEQWEESITQRFNSALELLQNDIKEHKQEMQESRELEEKRDPIRAQKRILCENMEKELSEVTAIEEPSLELRTQIELSVKEAREKWAQSGDLPKNEQQSYTSRFIKVCAAMEKTAQEVLFWENANTQLQKLKNNLQARLRKKKPIEAHEIDRFELKASQIKTPTHYETTRGIEKEIGNLVESLKNRLNTELAKQKQNLDKAKKLILELESVLANGKSKEAVQVQKTIQKLLQDMPGRDIKWLQEHEYQDRFNQASKQVQELRDWKRWASTPLKQKLVEEMEQLADEVNQSSVALDFNSLSREIQNARNEWRKLGESEPDSAQELWDRFNQACNKAYEPCNAYFEAQAHYREDNLKKKQVICQELDNFFLHAHWEEMDWKRAERILRVAQSEWMAIGPVDRKDKTGIVKKFHAVMDELRGKLKEHRVKNEELKTNLIERARELVTVVESDTVTDVQLKSAIEQAKSLQSEWKNIGTASSEKQLWKKFRSACNKIFDRRKEQIEAQDHERKDNLQAKIAICERLDRFSTLQGESVSKIEDLLQQIKRDWSVIGPIPKEALKELNLRYKNTCKNAERHIQKVHLDEQKEKVALMLKKIDLCVGVEFLIEVNDNSMPKLEDLQKEWQLLQTRDDYLEQPLQERFQNAVQRVVSQEQNDDAQLNELRLSNEKCMEQLCVRLEVLAEVDSPPEASHARMEYQVSRLAKKMQDGDVLESWEKRSAQENEALSLLREWSAMGPVSKQRFLDLNPRFLNTLEHIFKKT